MTVERIYYKFITTLLQIFLRLFPRRTASANSVNRRPRTSLFVLDLRNRVIYGDILYTTRPSKSINRDNLVPFCAPIVA